MTRTLTLVLVGLCLAPGAAWAYSEAAAFLHDPSAEPTGGGGGLLFTGSPRQHGLTCSVCHVDGPESRGIRVSSLDATGADGRLFEDGYTPGEVYELEVAFVGETLAPAGGCGGYDFEPCDLNLFATEILDGEARPAGAFCSVAPDAGAVDPADPCARCSETHLAGTLITDACHAALADGFNEIESRWRNGVTATSFFWQAPAEDIGPLTLYLSAVDGRGKETPDGEVTSYQHDAAADLVLGLGPHRKGGCQGAPPTALLLPLLGLFARRRRRPSTT